MPEQHRRNHLRKSREGAWALGTLACAGTAAWRQGGASTQGQLSGVGGTFATEYRRYLRYLKVL